MPSWIDPQSVQPYFDINPHSRARATLLRSGRPQYAATSSSSCSSERFDSLQTLPSSNDASLLPEYS